MRAVLCATGFAAWFGVVEAAAGRLRLDHETSRKLVHVTAGLTAALMPLALTFSQITALGVVFAVAMAVSRRLGILRSIHRVERTTWGEVCLPLGVAATAAVLPDPACYAWAVATVAVGDVAACAAGRRWGGAGWTLPGGTKTWAGSAAFFVTALAVGLALLAAPGGGVRAGLGTALAVAGLTTVAEAVSPRGLDNVAIPLAAAALLAGG